MEKVGGTMLGGPMPWNPAAFSPPEAGPGVMPTLAGLNIGGGAKDGAEGPDDAEGSGPSRRYCRRRL